MMKWLVSIAALVGAWWAQAAADMSNPHHDASRPHHRPGGFQNNHLAFEPKGMLSFLQWQWDAWRDGTPRPAQAPTPPWSPQ